MSAPSKAPLRVLLGLGITDDEAEAIQQIFMDEGITVSVEPGYGVGGGVAEATMAIHWILAVSLAWGASHLLDVGTNRLGRALKRCVARQKERAGPNGITTVHCEPTNLHLSLPSGTPDDAFDEVPWLLQHCADTTLHYDTTRGRWISQEHQLREESIRLRQERDDLYQRLHQHDLGARLRRWLNAQEQQSRARQATRKQRKHSR